MYVDIPLPTLTDLQEFINALCLRAVSERRMVSYFLSDLSIFNDNT